MPGRQDGIEAGFLRHGSARAVQAGLALAGTLAVLVAVLLPRIPAVWHMHLISPGWLPHQLVKLLEYSNDIQVALLSERNPAPHPRIALVLITEDTLAELPYVTPIDRSLVARLIKGLDDLGARAIGLDMLFDQATEARKDDALWERFKLTRAALVLGGADERTPLSARRRAWQTAFLDKVGRPFGFFNLRYDVREAAQTHVIRNRAEAAAGSIFTMSFAEAVARQVGIGQMPESRRIAWLRPPSQGGDAFVSIDADAVLAASAEPDGVLARALEEQISGRIVLVGADLLGRDRHPTPLSVVDQGDMLGVAVHAQVLAALIDGRTLGDLDPVQASALAGTATLLGALIGWFAARRRMILTLLIGCGTLAIVGLSAFMLWQLRVIVPVAALVASLVGAVMVARLVRAYGTRA